MPWFHRAAEKSVLEPGEAVCRRDLPEEHLAGFAVGGLVKRVHLEAMMVGIGLVWLDV